MRRLLVLPLTLIIVTLPTFTLGSMAAEHAPPRRFASPQVSATPPAGVEWIDIGGGLDFYYYFAPDEYALYLLGEVRNRNAEMVDAPTIMLTLLDEDDNIVGVVPAIDLYPVIEPGTTTPYQVVVDPSIAPGSWDDETVEVLGGGQGLVTCSSEMELRNVEQVEKSALQLRITGKVYNGGTLPLDGVIIWAAVYRDDGVFAGASNESIGTAIPPHKTAAFSLFGLRVPGLLVPDASPDYTYRLFATNTFGGSTYC